MRTPLSARIGVYFILAGLTFDLILHYAAGVEYFIPGIGAFSTILFPLGLILVVGTAIFQLIALGRERAERISLTSPGPHSEELQIGHGPPLSLREQRVDIGRPLRRSAWVGVGLVLFGIALFTGIQRWMATRTFTPVDMPISLASGQVRTGAFHINLEGEYQIRLGASDYDLIDPKCVSLTPFKVRWGLHDGGKVFASERQGYLPGYIGEFYSNKGTYDVDLQVLSDSNCLNSGHPRLRIYTDKSTYEDDAAPALWFSVLSIAVGTSLLVFFVLARYQSRSTAITDITHSETIIPYFQWAQRLPLKPAFSGLPSFGLVCALFSSWLVMLHMVFYQGGRFRSMGITVSVMQHVPPVEGSDRWVEPLVLRVQAAGPGLAPKLFLNSRLLSWEELNSGLKAELSKRSAWVVYVEADSNLPWQDALNAIDAAGSLNAKVVLLTVKSRN